MKEQAERAMKLHDLGKEAMRLAGQCLEDAERILEDAKEEDLHYAKQHLQNAYLATALAQGLEDAALHIVAPFRWELEEEV